MQKSVYSIVLMDDVVAAVDRLAYSEGTSRSNMINRILAEYTSMVTPEQQMKGVFSAINALLDGQSVLQPLLESDAMLTVRSALQYKYNPSVRYTVELYPHTGEQLGEVRAGLRTQNPALLLYIGQFYRLWAQLEGACLNGVPREYEIANGRFTRRLQTPHAACTAEQLGTAITDYIRLFDACLKTYFEYLDAPAEGAAAVQRVYRQSLDDLTAQL